LPQLWHQCRLGKWFLRRLWPAYDRRNCCRDSSGVHHANAEDRSRSFSWNRGLGRTLPPGRYGWSNWHSRADADGPWHGSRGGSVSQTHTRKSSRVAAEDYAEQPSRRSGRSGLLAFPETPAVNGDERKSLRNSLETRDQLLDILQ